MVLTMNGADFPKNITHIVAGRGRGKTGIYSLLDFGGKNLKNGV
jgi:hypothetical protein